MCFKFCKSYISVFFVLGLIVSISGYVCAKPFAKDTRTKELKYKYGVLKQDERDKMEGKILNLKPSGYMTVDEYEKMSEYKDKSTLEAIIPKIETPSDFKYIPKPLYRIVKYNDPPGGVELSLGKKLYSYRQINAQGIVSPDFSMLVYPAVYYYTDSASVASDLFVIPLEDGDTNLNKILKANVARRNPVPILSTDKAIDNYASFRSLTPVDFSQDGTKLLVKEKIGSSEDGIWETLVYVYDFQTKTDYDLKEVRDAIIYFWKEYMELNLEDNRWDIYPLGFDKNNPDRIIVQGFAFTGVVPVFLGTWSVDSKGNQSRLVSFNKNYVPQVSINGYKIIQDGVEEYQTVVKQEEFLKKETKYLQKEAKKEQKELIKNIQDEYKYTIKGLNDDYKDDYRDLKKLRSLSGSTEGNELQEAYEKYLIDQLNKDIDKATKKIDNKKKQLDKIDEKLDKLYTDSGATSKQSDDSVESGDENENSENELTQD
ncbi:hypothetical protein IJ541_03225 [bacterium]|nr:hypothetical protein [bacterium]